MKRAFRSAGLVAAGTIVALLIALLAVQVLTRTDWGMERARRFALGWLSQRVHGTITIGRLSGSGLLDGVVLHDVSITDRRERSFLAVDSVRAAYHWRTLLSGRIVLDRVDLYRPRVNIEQLPGDTAWNYQYLFADTTPPDPNRPSVRRLVLFRQVHIVAGSATVLTPVAPRPRVPADTARLVLERLPDGLARLLRFRNVEASLGRVLWESPRDSGKVIDVDRLSGSAFIYRDSLLVADGRGRVAVRDSVVSLELPHVALPASAATIHGTVVVANGRQYYDLQVDADHFAFPDLHWISDRLPGDGGGSLRLLIQSQRGSNSTLWQADAIAVQSGGSSLAGTLGVVLGETTYFRRVDLRASPLDVTLLERLLPDSLPVSGALVGTIELAGPLSALETSGDLRLRAGETGSERATGSGEVRWTGVLDVRPGRLGSRRLQADLQRFDLGLIDAWRPELGLSGAVSGRVSATGELASELHFDADLRHHPLSGDSSRVVASGSLTGTPGARALQLELDAEPFALDQLALRYPALTGLRGEATGHLTVSGPLDQLAYDASLRTSAGPLRLRGQLARGQAALRYQGTADVSAFHLNALSPRLPETTLNGTVGFDITGTGLGTMRGDLQVLFDSARVLRIPLRRSLMQARVGDGLLMIDTLHAATLAGDVTARGSLGLVPERSGTMSLDLRSAAVGLLEADIFGAAASTEPEAPLLAGSVQARGSLSGNIQQLQAAGEGDVRELVLGPLRLAHGRARFTAALSRDSVEAELHASADSAAVYGQRLDTASLTLTHTRGITSFALEGRNRDSARDLLSVAGWARRTPGATSVALDRLQLGDSVRWQLADSVLVQLTGDELAVSPTELRRTDGDGSVSAQGILAWSADSTSPQPVDFRLQLSGVPFADLLRAGRSSASGAGRLDGGVRVTGTTLAPLIDADLTATRLAYDDVRLERGFAELSFADQGLELFLEALHGNERVLYGGGRVPLDLRFTDVKQRRLDRPLSLRLEADSLPAAQVLPFVDGFGQVEGWFGGEITAAGTTLDPALSGSLRASRVAATWAATGVRYTDLSGTFDLVSDRVVEVNASTRTRDPRREGATGEGVVTGTLDIARLSDPGFALDFTANGVLAAQRRDVEAVVTGGIHLGGHYSSPRVSGNLRVDRGVMYLDELYRQFFVVQLDSASMFQFVDTSLVARRRVLPVSRNPFLENLRIDSTQVSVGAGSWLRSQDLDVEVQGDLNVAFDRRADDLRMSGTLDVIRGTYQLVYPPLQARRFRVSDGTIEFTGLPGIDPNLAISAVYQGRAGNEPLDIIAEVNGTLQNPRVRLTSDEEPPISESDLASYLFFGVPTWEMGNLVGAQSGETRGALTGLSRTFAPSLLGYASSGLQTLAQGAGLLDYVSLTAAEAPPGTEGAAARASFFAGAQLELGRYLTRNVYLGVSQRLSSASREPALRLEWRFHPSSTLELFSEERFARGSASFGYGYTPEALLRPVYGFSLFREWDY